MGCEWGAKSILKPVPDWQWMRCWVSRAGKGRMFKCLQESLAQPDFGQACRAQVEERGQRMQEDYRLDYGVAEACEPDVTTYCAAEKVQILPCTCSQAMHTMPDAVD